MSGRRRQIRGGVNDQGKAFSLFAVQVILGFGERRSWGNLRRSRLSLKIKKTCTSRENQFLEPWQSNWTSRSNAKVGQLTLSPVLDTEQGSGKLFKVRLSAFLCCFPLLTSMTRWRCALFEVFLFFQSNFCDPTAWAKESYGIQCRPGCFWIGARLERYIWDSKVGSFCFMCDLLFNCRHINYGTVTPLHHLTN